MSLAPLETRMIVYRSLSLVGFHWVPVILSAWLAVVLSGSRWLPVVLNGY